MGSFATFPEFWASAILAQLYNKSVVLNLVHRDFSQLVASKGETVHATLPAKATVQDVDTTTPSSVDASATSIPVTLDKWRETKPIKFTDKMNSMSEVDLVQLYAMPMAEAIIEDVEKALISTAETFTTSVVNTLDTVGKFAEVKKQFDTALIPAENRSVVLSPAGEQSYHTLFGVYNVGGDAGVADQITGQLGARFGIGFYGQPLVANELGIAFDRNAIALVTRPLGISPGAPAGSQAVQSYKGLGIRVVIAYDGRLKSTFITADVLYGAKVLDDRRGFLIKAS